MMKNNNIINKMNIQEPADKLAKTVGKPLKFHIGSREATFFTKSTEYGKLIDNNNHNDYLKEEESKRVTRAAFAQHFKMDSDGGSSNDMFDTAVDDIEMTQANEEAAREEIERQQMDREDQRQAAQEIVKEQISKMLMGVDTEIDKKVREEVIRRKYKTLKTSSQPFIHFKPRAAPIEVKTTEQSSVIKSKQGFGETTPKELLSHAVRGETTQGMDVDRPDAGIKRVMKESQASQIKRAATGTEVISDLLNILDNQKLTIPMIKQQMIMRGFDDFNKRASREELTTMIKSSDPKVWDYEVEATLVAKRLKTYKEDHGELPIVLKTSESSSSTDKPAAKPAAKPEPKPAAKPAAKPEPKPAAKPAAKPEPKPAAKPEPKPEAKPEERASKKSKAKVEPKPEAKPKPEASSDEDIDLPHQAPIVAPSRTNISILREQLIKAFNSGKIKDTGDLEIYNKNMNFKAYSRSTDETEKKYIIKNLTYLYKKYVYKPSKEENKAKKLQGSPKNVRQTITKTKK